MADGGEALGVDNYIEILLRSGAVDLLGWRLVSWEWNRVITSRSFLVAHRRRNNPRPLPIIRFSTGARLLAPAVPLLSDTKPLPCGHDEGMDGAAELAPLLHGDAVPLPGTRGLSDPRPRDEDLFLGGAPLVPRHGDLLLLLSDHEGIDASAAQISHLLHGDDTPLFGVRDLFDPKAPREDQEMDAAVLVSRHGDHSLLLGDRGFADPGPVVLAEGAGTFLQVHGDLALLLGGLSDHDARACGFLIGSGTDALPEASRVGPCIAQPLHGTDTVSLDSHLEGFSDYKPNGRRIPLRFDAMDVREGISARLIQFRGDEAACTIHACLDGVLLVSYDEFLYSLNPCTGSYIGLPPIHINSKILGFYSIELPMKEHQSHQSILYCTNKQPHEYWHFNLETNHYTCLGRPAASHEVGMVLESGMIGCVFPAVLLNGNLHWILTNGSNILVFDLDAFVFSFMKPPEVKFPSYQMIELGGILTVSEVDGDELVVKMWMLHDYPAGNWSDDLIIPLSLGLIDMFVDDYDRFGDPQVYIVSEEGDILVECPEDLLHFDHQGKFLGRYHHGYFTLHFFRSGLLPEV